MGQLQLPNSKENTLNQTSAGVGPDEHGTAAGSTRNRGKFVALSRAGMKGKLGKNYMRRRGLKGWEHRRIICGEKPSNRPQPEIIKRELAKKKQKGEGKKRYGNRVSGRRGFRITLSERREEGL